MRQTVAFHATRFDCSPVEVEVAEGSEEPEEGTLPVALLAFESGGNMLMTIPIGVRDAEGIMGAFSQAEPHRESIPEAAGWEPQAAGLSPGMLWVLTPEIVGMSVTPPQNTPDGLVPHWTMAFEDSDGSQVQVAISDAMCVQVVRALAQIAHGEFSGDGATD